MSAKHVVQYHAATFTASVVRDRTRICHCDDERDAEIIAAALNAVDALEDTLTDTSITASHRCTEAINILARKYTDDPRHPAEDAERRSPVGEEDQEG